MNRISVFTMAVVAVILFATAVSAQADRLTALEIFEGMIYYENDQLETNPRITDYYCIKTETMVRTRSATQEIVVKDIYFMVPGYYLEMIGENPAFYRDVTDVGNHLMIVDLGKLRDERVNGIDCYVIQMAPKDPAYKKYVKTYYVAKDDFRKIKTVSLNANDEMDDLKTEITYSYGEFDGFRLLSGEEAVWTDKDGNTLATVTTVYSDYEFNVGLDDKFFASHREGKTVIPPLT